MAEKNEQTIDDLAYSMAGMIGFTIDRIQKIVKAPMSTIQRVANDFPKFLILKWIPEGIEVALGFANGGVSYKIYEPEGLEDYPTEYQEKIAEIHQEMEKLGFAPVIRK